MADEENFENLPKKDRDSFWKKLGDQKKLRKKYGVDSMDTKQGHHSRKWEQKNKKGEN